MRKIFFILLLSCNSEKDSPVKESNNSDCIVSKVILMASDDGLFPIFPDRLLSVRGSYNCRYYEFVSKLNGMEVLTVDTTGNMVIKDSLAAIKSLLFYLKMKNDDFKHRH